MTTTPYAGFRGPTRRVPRPRRRRTLLVTITVALAVLAGGSNLAARGLLHHRIAAAVTGPLKGDVDVSVSGGPALLQIFDKHLPSVEISSDDAQLNGITGIGMDVTLDDVRVGGSGASAGTVTRSHADISIPTAGIQHRLQGSIQRITVTDVRTDPSSHTLQIVLGSDLGLVTLRPQIDSGRVGLTVVSVQFLGRAAPERLTDRIRQSLTSDPASGKDKSYPLGLKATSVDVTSAGLHITLDGGHASLSKGTG